MTAAAVQMAAGGEVVFHLDKTWFRWLIFNRIDLQRSRAMESSPENATGVNTSWPPFLDLLDSNRNVAWGHFYVYARRLLTFSPPSCLRSLDDSEQAEIVDAIIAHCVDDNFRVLRTYRNTGRRFASWLYGIAFNFTIDHLRRKARQRKLQEKLSGRHDPADVSNPGRAENPVRFRELYRLTGEAIARLGRRCQLLLKLAADELTPKEMLPLLNEPDTDNAKVSDDLRYCRRKLRDLLSAQGVDLEAELGE